MRVERFSLFFPPLLAPPQARRDRVRDRGDPARRLREDHRDEPGGGDPAGGRPPRVLPPAGVEADRRDLRRPGREHRARVRDPVGAAVGQRAARGHRQGRARDGRAGARRAGAGRPDRLRGRRARRLRDAARADLLAQVRGRAGRRLQGRDARHDRRLAARRGAHAARCGRSTTPPRTTCSSASRPTHEAGADRPRRRGRRVDLRDVVLHDQDGRDDRRHLPGREAQGAVRRRRLLRGDAADDRARRPARALPARDHLPVARRDQPVPVPAARRRAHLLGAWRRRSAAARSRSA